MTPTDDNGGAAERTAPARRGMAPWKKALLGASCLLMLAGGALKGYGLLRGREGEAKRQGASGGEGDGKGTGPGVSGLPVQRLVPSPPSASAPQPAAAEGQDSSQGADGGAEQWAPLVFRLGFGFFVGFCIAYALRAFLKITVLLIGLALLAVLGLQYAGLIDVDFSSIQGHYESIVGSLRERIDSFASFVRSVLPASATGAMGFLTGIRKG